MHVEAAAAIANYSTSGTIYSSADSLYVSYYTGATHLIAFNAYEINGGQHIEIPFSFSIPTSSFSGVPVSPQNYYYMMLGNNNFSVSSGNVTNLCLKDSNSNLIWSSGEYWGKKIYMSGYEAYDSSYSNLVFHGYISFDFTFNEGRNGQNGNQIFSGTWSFSDSVYLTNVSESEYSANGNVVRMPGVESSVDSIENDTSTNVRNTTGILSKITDFFGSFFENIINALKSLFIPEDGYFTNWFTRLNDLLSAKLGMLYAPFDLVISVLTALGSASTSEAGIPFPELAWDGQVIIPAQTFYFSSLGSSFSDLRDAVYFGTDVVLLFAFLVLLQRKINLVMRGSEEG